MAPERETARSRERAPGRAEHIEMLAAIGSQGLGDCLNWIVMQLEDCQRADQASAEREARWGHAA